MPIAGSQPVYGPYAGQPVDEAWGDAVAEGVIQRFANFTDLALRWTSPPDGSLASVNGLLYTRLGTNWRPLTTQTDSFWISTGSMGDNIAHWQGESILCTFAPALYNCTVVFRSDGYAGYSYANGHYDVFLATDKRVPMGPGLPEYPGPPKWASRCSIQPQNSPYWQWFHNQLIVPGFASGEVVKCWMLYNHSTPNCYAQAHITATYLYTGALIEA